VLRHLRIRRPLTFFDVETTGLEPRRDRIIEIALVRFAPEIRPRALVLRFNPERPIPAAASAIHGIRDEHVARSPTFATSAPRLASFLGDCDLAGFGIARFDLPFLVVEFERAGWSFPLHGRKIVDVLRLFHRLEPRDLAAAVRRYAGRDHRNAHRAKRDVFASVRVLEGMLAKCKEVPRTVAELHSQLVDVDIEGWFRRSGSTVLLARGKHRDVPLEQVASSDLSYLFWLADHVLPDARWFIERALDGRSD
jgi:DNA polymerase III subunit epsilon